ncbi:hypothetical protein FQN60_014107 [Etheostoma spectabile]|uniref:Uncharacterized protein n=1 Tax=Etheostoma spectabile TaxID=54343 RepID=A0A5J5DAR0_9PERO|nr:hypothetical protein FQN60_014107 [Etheostoma spectabile]
MASERRDTMTATCEGKLRAVDTVDSPGTWTGRKDSGVIFTTVTGLPLNDRLERNERERPSGSGLQFPEDETGGSERASGGPKERDMKRKQVVRRWKKRQKGMEIPENTQK